MQCRYFICNLYLNNAFVGTSVSVLGTIPSQSESLPSTSTYVLDNNPSTRFTFTPTLGQAPVYQQLFYQSPTLPDGAHSLTIQSTTNGSWFWLDAIVITATSTDTNLNSTSPTSTPTSTPSAERSSAGSKSLIGSVVGAVIGALLLIVVAGLLFFSYFRRRQRRRSHSSSSISHVLRYRILTRIRTCSLGKTVSPFTRQPTHNLPMKASQPVWEGFHQSASEPYPESVWPSQTYSYVSRTHTERSRTESPELYRDHRSLAPNAVLRDGYMP